MRAILESDITTLLASPLLSERNKHDLGTALSDEIIRHKAVNELLRLDDDSFLALARDAAEVSETGVSADVIAETLSDHDFISTRQSFDWTRPGFDKDYVRETFDHYLNFDELKGYQVSQLALALDYAAYGMSEPEPELLQHLDSLKKQNLPDRLVPAALMGKVLGINLINKVEAIEGCIDIKSKVMLENVYAKGLMQDLHARVDSVLDRVEGPKNQSKKQMGEPDESSKPKSTWMEKFTTNPFRKLESKILKPLVGLVVGAGFSVLAYLSMSSSNVQGLDEATMHKMVEHATKVESIGVYKDKTLGLDVGSTPSRDSVLNDLYKDVSGYSFVNEINAKVANTIVCKLDVLQLYREAFVRNNGTFPDSEKIYEQLVHARKVADCGYTIQEAERVVSLDKKLNIAIAQAFVHEAPLSEYHRQEIEAAIERLKELPEITTDRVKKNRIDKLLELVGGAASLAQGKTTQVLHQAEKSTRAFVHIPTKTDLDSRTEVQQPESAKRRFDAYN